MKKHAAPIIATILLVLPVLYVGSYLALVRPYSHSAWVVKGGILGIEYEHYRWGGSYSSTIFWPLEQIDRRVRPDAWAIFPRI